MTATRPGPMAFSLARMDRRRTVQFAIQRIKQLIRDEQGGEIIEYVLIAGLIIVAAISVIGAFGTKVLAKWTSVNSSL
jgi:pilus assembly protein Flp/PilA